MVLSLCRRSVGEAGWNALLPPLGESVDVTEPVAHLMTAVPAASRREKWLRRLRRTGVVVVSLFLLATVGSLLYNAATAGRAAPPSGVVFVRTGGFLTRYRTWGDPAAAGPPIVLIHGAFESAETWEPLAALLGRTHRVEAYDVKGLGYTERVPPYTVGALSEQLGDFLAARGLDRPILVGHSSGAGIIARFVLDHPDRVGGIVFIDGDALDSGVPRWPARVIRGPWRTTVARLIIRSDRAIRFFYGRMCGPRCPALDDAGLDQWRRPLQVPGAEEALWAMARTGIPGLAADEVARIAALRVPAAVIFGADDPGYPANSATETAARIGAPAPTLIAHARHLPFISDPAAVAAAIEQLGPHAH
jgi:pimeloyl-ACP methyl ester carboxylesterase